MEVEPLDAQRVADYLRRIQDTIRARLTEWGATLAGDRPTGARGADPAPATTRRGGTLGPPDHHGRRHLYTVGTEESFTLGPLHAGIGLDERLAALAAAE
jgi:hypothetical protein